MSEPKPYGILAFKLRNQDLLVSKLLSRPWIKSALPLAGKNAEESGYASIRSNNWNVLVTDAGFFDVGRGVESPFTVLTSKIPRSVTDTTRRSSRLPVSIAPFQIVNHLPCSSSLTNKAALVRALGRQYSGQSVHPFDVTPVAYYVSKGARSEADSPVLAQFYKRMAAVSHGQYDGLRMPAKMCSNNLWVVKPAGCGGARKAMIVSTAEDVATVISAMNTDFVIQKYVERPLTLSGYKVTVRLHVLVTDSADVYVHRAGLVLLASSPYQPLPLPALGSVQQHHAVHVTTSAVQSSCAGFGAVSPGNVISFDQLQSAIDAMQAQRQQQGMKSVAGHYQQLAGAAASAAFTAASAHSVLPPNVIHDTVVPRMKKIVVDAVRGAFACSMATDPASSPLFVSPAGAASVDGLGGAGGAASAGGDGTGAAVLVNVASASAGGHPRAGFKGRRCFELMACDFLLDEDLRPWLLGFSDNPDMTTLRAAPPQGHPSVASLYDSLCEEVVRLAVDPLLPAPPLPRTDRATAGVGEGNSLPTPGFDAAAYAHAAAFIPTSASALEACSREQAKLASVMARASTPQAYTSAGMRASPLVPTGVPFTPAVPSSALEGVQGPLWGFELCYRSMGAEEEESEAYITMACSAGAGAGAAQGGLVDGGFGSSTAYSSAVAARINESLCATLPPRSRALTTVPQWAFAGPEPLRHSLAWLEQAGGAEAVLAPGQMVIEDAAPNVRAPGTAVASPNGFFPPRSPGEQPQFPSPRAPSQARPSSSPAWGSISPATPTSPSSSNDTFAHTGQLHAAVAAAVRNAGSPRSPLLPSSSMQAQRKDEGGSAGPAALAHNSVEAAATAVTSFLVRSGADPVETAMKLAHALGEAVAAGRAAEPAAGMPGGLTNQALLTALQAALPALVQVARAKKAKQQAQPVSVSEPTQPQAPGQQQGSRATSAGPASSRKGNGYAHVSSRVDTGAHAPPKPKAAAPPLAPASARGRQAASQGTGGRSRASSSQAQLATAATTLQSYAGRGEEEASLPSFMRSTAAARAASSSTPSTQHHTPGPVYVNGGINHHGTSRPSNSRIPVLSASQRKVAYQHHQQGMGMGQGGAGDFTSPSSSPRTRMHAHERPMQDEAARGSSEKPSEELAALLAGLFAAPASSPTGGTAMPAQQHARSVSFSEQASSSSSASASSSAGGYASQQGQQPTRQSMYPAQPAMGSSSHYAASAAAAGVMGGYLQDSASRAGRQALLPAQDIDTLAVPMREHAFHAAQQAVQAARMTSQQAGSVLQGYQQRQAPVVANEFSAYTSLAAYVRDKSGTAGQPLAPVFQRPTAEVPQGGMYHAGPAAVLSSSVAAGQEAAASLFQRYAAGSFSAPLPPQSQQAPSPAPFTLTSLQQAAQGARVQQPQAGHGQGQVQPPRRHLSDARALSDAVALSASASASRPAATTYARQPLPAAAQAQAPSLGLNWAIARQDAYGQQRSEASYLHPSTSASATPLSIAAWGAGEPHASSAASSSEGMTPKKPAALADDRLATADGAAGAADAAPVEPRATGRTGRRGATTGSPVRHEAPLPVPVPAALPPMEGTEDDVARLAAMLPVGEPAPSHEARSTPEVWVAVPQPPGSPQPYYYYHAVTRETTWQAPSGEDVVIVAQNDLEALASVASPGA